MCGALTYRYRVLLNGSWCLKSECAGYYRKCAGFLSECAGYHSKCAGCYRKCARNYGKCAAYYNECADYYRKCAGCYNKCEDYHGKCAGCYRKTETRENGDFTLFGRGNGLVLRADGTLGTCGTMDLQGRCALGREAGNYTKVFGGDYWRGGLRRIFFGSLGSRVYVLEKLPRQQYYKSINIYFYLYHYKYL